MSDSPDNVTSLVDLRKFQLAEETVAVAITEEFYTFLLDQSDERFSTDEEKRAFIIGGACAVGFYGKEIKRGLEND